MFGAHYHARQIEKRLETIQPNWDIAIAIDSLLPVGALNLAKPLIYISDCTKAQLVQLKYPGYADMSKANLRSTMAFERNAYQNCDLLVFASQWACDSAVSQYGVPRRKVRAIPYGANLDDVPERHSTLEVRAGTDGLCRLLFLGVQWERKGGDMAVAVTKALNAQGLPAELTICGCVPPSATPNVRVIPFLDKHKTEDRHRLNRLLTKASYLIVPTKGDCSPIVFCEAFAYGLPVVTCNVGGVPEIVTHGVNGFVLDPNAPAEEFAELIVENYRNQEAYLQFCIAARNAYEMTFNWQHWARAIYTLAQGLVVS
jgi:glycosyltransferase involved in cell wall biosynthesis